MTPAPTPHSLIHGAAGFCTDHAQRPEERTETVARELLDHQPGVRLDNDSETPDHPDVTGTCWCGWETRPELFAWRRREQHRAHQAAAVVAALDDETARLRASVCSMDDTLREHLARVAAEGIAVPEVATFAQYLLLTHPTDGEWASVAGENDRAAWAFMAERDAARAALDRVRALHKPVWDGARGVHRCAECGADLTAATPDCPTVAALDPEEPR